jgi:hypothetical protein
MSGKRDRNRRAGDRSEYMAAFGLSRFALVNPVPRQEDFGVVDFFCILTRDAGRFSYPESGFYVQVKSKAERWVLDSDAIRWVSHHMDHPLFLCVADKTLGQLSFYSTSHLWLVLFLRPDAAKVVLCPDETLGPERYVPIDGATADFEVGLGPPTCRVTLSELEDHPAAIFPTMDAWARQDADNIARRRLGRLAVRCFFEWQTNVVPTAAFFDRYYFGPSYPIAESALVPILTALGHNYVHARDRKKFAGLRELLESLAPVLGEHGRMMVDGSIHIDP